MKCQSGGVVEAVIDRKGAARQKRIKISERQKRGRC